MVCLWLLKREQETMFLKAPIQEDFSLGLEHPTVHASIIKVARSLDITKRSLDCRVKWNSQSSLQKAWIGAKFHIVQVGHGMKKEEIGLQNIGNHFTNLTSQSKNMRNLHFQVHQNMMRAWSFILKYGKRDCLFWNVEHKKLN